MLSTTAGAAGSAAGGGSWGDCIFIVAATAIMDAQVVIRVSGAVHDGFIFLVTRISVWLVNKTLRLEDSEVV